MYLATGYFRHYLKGRVFALFTEPQAPDPCPRQRRRTFPAPDTTSHSWPNSLNIRHIKGPDNVVADTLSRAVTAASLPTLDLATVAARQIQSEEMSFYHSLETRIQPGSVPFQGTNVWCDVSTGRTHPIIQRSFTREVFDAVRNLRHAGPPSHTLSGS